MNLSGLVATATIELRGKSLRDIQVETAYTWAARAVAASRLGRIADAREYWHEAVEHAALAGIGVLFDVQKQVGVALGSQAYNALQ